MNRTLVALRQAHERTNGARFASRCYFLAKPASWYKGSFSLKHRKDELEVFAEFLGLSRHKIIVGPFTQFLGLKSSGRRQGHVPAMFAISNLRPPTKPDCLEDVDESVPEDPFDVDRMSCSCGFMLAVDRPGDLHRTDPAHWTGSILFGQRHPSLKGLKKFCTWQ